MLEEQFWPNDVRRYGTNAAQQAIDVMLDRWAERTRNIRQSAESSFSPAIFNVAGQQQDPQADWKRTANGKETRRKSTGKPNVIEQQLGELTGRLLMDEPKQYALLCLHYGAFQYVEHYGKSPAQKAAYLGITEGTYRNRLTAIRKYFVENWPDKMMLQ